MEQMRKIDFVGKSVFDFGTGTGVLAILAEKLGASKIVAADDDPWSITNAQENLEKNNCIAIDIQLLNSANINRQFDIILSNINKNVILENIDHFKQILSDRGVLFLSGFFPGDKTDILEKCLHNGLKINSEEQRHNWLFLSLSHGRIKY